MMMPFLPLTAVVINFRTSDLTRVAVSSLRRYYPSLPLLLIDNGSGDDSDSVLKELQHLSPSFTEILLNDHNLHHGPAMDMALRKIQTPYILFLDSDCEVRRGGFIEEMIGLIEQKPEHYAVGKKIFMNNRGFDVPEGSNASPYIRPMCMLLRREQYLTLPPFALHGAPCLLNMQHAVQRGLSIVHYPVEEYIRHRGRGTADRHGYRLGWRGRLNHLLNRIGL